MNWISIRDFIITLLAVAVIAIPLYRWGRKILPYRLARYRSPEHKKNARFLLITAGVGVLILFIWQTINDLMAWLSQSSFFTQVTGFIFNALQNKGNFAADVIFRIFAANIAILLLMMIVKILARAFFDGIDSPKKRKKKEHDHSPFGPKEPEGDKTPVPEDEFSKDGSRTPIVYHEGEEDGESETAASADETPEEPTLFQKLTHAVSELLFEGPDLLRPKPWLARPISILQTFIYITATCYLGFFLLLLISLFMELDETVYAFLLYFTNHVFLYPIVPLLLLQEICDTFDYKPGKPKKDGEKSETETAEDEEAEDEETEKAPAPSEERIKLRHLRTDLFRRFGKIHDIRCFPTPIRKEIPSYVFSNDTYREALEYIRSIMEQKFGFATQSYLAGLDAAFNHQNVYFSASFYSQLGEYLIAYAHMRLMTGERVLIVAMDHKKANTLKKYISSRLNDISGHRVWRVRGGANFSLAKSTDVLIATPEDFLEDNLVEYHPRFFEEVGTAIFIDADRIVSLDSYLCPIMAKRLQAVTNNNIRFIFTTRNLIYGFANSLRKLFCIDRITEHHGAAENEDVSYMLWKRESPILYGENRQHLVTVEGQIAKAAIAEGVDGVRILTAMPLENSEKEYLLAHHTEINNLYKEIPDISYLICTDDQCNLAATLYCFTRFRGKKESFLHILAKPYLLREYFMSNIEMYIRKSSFIKPRVSEHVNEHKRRVLNVFLDATATPDGMPVAEFQRRIGAIRDFFEQNPLPNVGKIGHPSAEIPADCAACIGIRRRRRSEEAETLKNDVCYMLEILTDNNREITGEPMNYYQLSEKVEFARTEVVQHITFRRSALIFKELQKNNRRAELWTNDRLVGCLDTFPSRVYQQYIPGQSIVYDNIEYEIMGISNDGTRIDLRQQNVTFRNCLDTFFLRRYLLTGIQDTNSICGAYTHTNGVLDGIYLKKQTADVLHGITYGFYNLMTDSQTIDFVKGTVGNGVVGTPHLEDSIVKRCMRNVANCPLLSVRLVSREPCNDKMRLLLSAVLNEMLRTMFPDTYRCIAVCPVLEDPHALTAYEGFDRHVATLYPYLDEQCTLYGERKASANEIEFLILNDCHEDIGVLDMLYDGQARIIEEIFSYIYRFLRWLKKDIDEGNGTAHYIFFGSDHLPEVFDLDGCLKLLENCKRRFEDDEIDDPSRHNDPDESLRCAFCHKPLERGRYFRFDRNRYICADCEITAVSNRQELDRIYAKVMSYLKKTYPAVEFPNDLTVKLTSLLSPAEGNVMSEDYYRIDLAAREILVEQDNPEATVAVSILHGIIAFWQADRGYFDIRAITQLYHEELIWLDALGMTESTAYIREHLKDEITREMEKLLQYIADAPEGETRNSFTYLTDGGDSGNGDGEGEGEDDGNALYDPNCTPRFWKQYLLGHHASDEDDGNDRENESDVVPDDEEGDENKKPDDGTDTPEDETEGDADTVEMNESVQNAPIPDETPEGETGESADEPKPKKKKKLWPWSRRKKKPVKQTDEEENTDGEPTDNTDPPTPTEDEEPVNTEDTDETDGARKRKKKKTRTDGTEDGDEKPKPKKRRQSKNVRPLLGVIKSPEELFPHEPEEDTNPEIRLYNEIGRHIAGFDTSMIPLNGIPMKRAIRVLYFVLYDYPEFIWVRPGYYQNGTKTEISPLFCCLDKSGKQVDVPRVKKYLREIGHASRRYLKGIRTGTSPYQAMLAIYRRIIKDFSYDSIGLEQSRQQREIDLENYDQLRSLHSALCKHNVVCVGYAVAMQYLLRAIGICCGQITSEKHEWNVVKLGKHCYHLDATWDDVSNTQTGDQNKDVVRFEHFCITTRDNNAGGTDRIPDPNIFFDLEEFTSTRHNYYHHENLFLTRYDESAMLDMFVRCLERDNHTITLRCSSPRLFDAVYDTLIHKGNFHTLLNQALERLPQKTRKKYKKIHLPDGCVRANRELSILTVIIDY